MTVDRRTDVSFGGDPQMACTARADNMYFRGLHLNPGRLLTWLRFSRNSFAGGKHDSELQVEPTHVGSL